MKSKVDHKNTPPAIFVSEKRFEVEGSAYVLSFFTPRNPASFSKPSPSLKSFSDVAAPIPLQLASLPSSSRCEWSPVLTSTDCEGLLQSFPQLPPPLCRLRHSTDLSGNLGTPYSLSCAVPVKFWSLQALSVKREATEMQNEVLSL